MPSPESAVLEAFDPVGDGLRVTFFWRVDRYAHRIERVESGIATLLLESIEGNDLEHALQPTADSRQPTANPPQPIADSQPPIVNPRWPPSPPLQQLSVENLPDSRPVALLVGMAGASHWSMTVEPEPGDASLLFDIACHVKEQGAALGTSYRSHVRHEGADGAVLLHRPGGKGQPAVVELVEIPGATHALPQIATDGRGVHLKIAGPIPPTQTVRWKYRIRVA